MAGRIKTDDIALVRERARIDEVIGDHVALKQTGGGNLSGLCPFHDEKTPSFNVTPARGLYYCFGCAAGGDVFKFLQEVEGLTFTDVVERLAVRYGVQLRYEEGEGGPRRPSGSQRPRLVAANQAAMDFYLDQLASSAEAITGRRFLDERGFDHETATSFGVGYAPRGGEVLTSHLRGRGFTDDELVSAGLSARGQRGLYDRFRGRLLWPIKDLSGDVVGFGARRLYDDDHVEAKYLNTPETSIYKKSQVLYGLDLARREIAKASQAVVVEGYTDVMAAHVSGVKTAVATCGTSFGEDHARVLRRLLLDHDEFRGEVIFTFDGDEAGQRAAMRAFQGDQRFVAQTYVAVEPSGLDPCDLRLKQGDAAVRELIARRVPLYRFVLGNVVGQFDLDRADQRVNAMREAATLVASVRDKSKIDAFARELAGMIGMDIDEVRTYVRQAARNPVRPPVRPGAPAPEQPVEPRGPDLREPRFADEREALKAVVQYPHLVGEAAADVDADDFTHPALAAVWTAMTEQPLPSEPRPEWIEQVRSRLSDEQAAGALAALAVAPLRTSGEPDGRFVDALLARLQELTALRRIETLKSRLQRTNPVEQTTDYNRMFGELMALEKHRISLRQRAIGVIG